MTTPINWTRRGLLGLTLTGAAVSLLPAAGAARTRPTVSRSLSFYNLHTGESLDVTYWAEGRYVKPALVEANKLLRDFRTNEVAQIDIGLFDLLHDLRTKLDSVEPFQVISGYRSPATNAKLAAQSSGVARRSLHTRGMAADVRLPGRELSDLRRAAKIMKRGGVGFYAKSNFVHLDVGRPRYW